MLRNDLEIRPLNVADMPAVFDAADTWWQGRSLSHLLQRFFFEHFQDGSFVLMQDNALIGFLVGFMSPGQRDSAYIHMVGVDPKWRGQGLGRFLYEHFFQLALAHDRTRILSITSPVNHNSIAFHRQMGFAILPGDKQVDGVWVTSDYDAKGVERVLFCRHLSAEVIQGA